MVSHSGSFLGKPHNVQFALGLWVNAGSVNAVVKQTEVFQSSAC